MVAAIEGGQTIQQVLGALSLASNRNAALADAIVRCQHERRHVLVLTERTEHLERLAQALSWASILTRENASFVPGMSFVPYTGRGWSVLGRAGLVGRLRISVPAFCSAIRTS